MARKQDIIEELARFGCKSADATCNHKVQIGDPRAKEGKPFPGIIVCGRYFDNDQNLRDVPNVDPAWAHQPHRDELFDLPPFGGYRPASSPSATRTPETTRGDAPTWPRPLDPASRSGG